MGQCCGKMPSEDDVKSIRDSIEEYHRERENANQPEKETEIEEVEIEETEIEKVEIEETETCNDNEEDGIRDESLGIPSSNSSEIDLSISESKDPFNDPIESMKNAHDWWTTEGNHIVEFTDSDGQINLDIVEGPDRGAHRFYDPENHREGQTGIENPKTGERRHDNG